jgi:cysteinyl-tRNA synthetase
LKIFNSLGREKQDFIPLVSGKVSIYVCGMTVYDYCHLGHARVMVFFDIVRRWFEASGLEVNYVRNITDIDDKIISRSIKEKTSIRALTDKFIFEMRKDAHLLGVIDPVHEPRATEYVSQMLDLIKKLESSGYAYESNGDVNFAVRNMKNYGKLSGKSIDQLRIGERVSNSGNKKDPLDFVLWKKSKPEEPVEASWNSPYGKGRPGWHIECSAMSSEILGPRFDIHGGGIDLQFPHHENEIAQSEGAFGCKSDENLVNTWMHVGFVTVEKEKMSKSLGNFSTIREILGDNDPESIRYFLLKGHYRSPINYSLEQIKNAKNSLRSLYHVLEIGEEKNELSQIEQKKYIDIAMKSDESFAREFRKAINDDFNTPKALSVLFAFATQIKDQIKSRNSSQITIFRGLGLILGFFSRSIEQERNSNNSFSLKISEDEINKLVTKRYAAKNNKDFKKADEIRNILNTQGIILEDSIDGTKWRRS